MTNASGRPTGYTSADFGHSPMVVFYETTQACDLACVHCRANAQACRDPGELSAEAARELVAQLATFPRPPLLVLTGGDPLKRPDVFALVDAAVAAGLQVAMTPSATPLVTRDAVRRLRQAGLHRLAVSLDGADAGTHDGFRRVTGSFARTLEIIADARDWGLPVQVNTTVCRHNVHQVDALADLCAGLDIVLWSVFFLVPTGRAGRDQRITPEEYETVFGQLFEHARRQPYAIKTTEAPHYRRYVVQAVRAAGGGAAGAGRGMAGGPMIGTNDGRGVMFVSHTGEIYPSGFLPLRAATFPQHSLVEVYQRSPVFTRLRDAGGFGGKCGACEFREVCGGSRARAFALTGDPLASDPDCVYVPVRWRNGRADAAERKLPAQGMGGG